MSPGSNHLDKDVEIGKSRIPLSPIFHETVTAHEQYIQSCSGTELSQGLQPIPTVLQRFASSYFSGKLEIFTKLESAALYFEGGNLVHAQIRDTKGDIAVREAVSWMVGATSYNQHQRATEKTVTRHLQSLIREGFVLLDQKKFLSHHPLYYESIVRRSTELSPDELKKTMGERQKNIVARLDTPCTLTDLIRDLEFETWEWVPAMFHLLEMNFLKIGEPRSNENVLAFADAEGTGLHALDGEMRSAQTGLYTWEALVLYLQRELHFQKAYNRPLSFIVMELESIPMGASVGKAEWLPYNEISAVERKFEMIKKPIDVFGHFEESEFALILPNTSQRQAAFLANRLAGAISHYTVTINTRPHRVNMHCGVATMPDVGSDMYTLINAAKIAKAQAKTAQIHLEIANVETVSMLEPSPTNGHNGSGSERKSQEIDMQELLLSAGALTIDQLDQAAALMSRLPVPLSLGRVLTMQGQIKESTINSAEELSKMVGDGRMMPEQALQAIELIACHGLDLKSALRRAGIAGAKPAVDELGDLLRATHVITDKRLQYAARQAEITELPLDTVLVGSGLLPRGLVRAARLLTARVANESFPRSKAIAVLQAMHEQSLSLQQALGEAVTD